MNKDILNLAITALIGLVVLGWGIHGVIKGDKAKKRGDYILSVGQIIGAIIIITAVILYYMINLR